MLSVFIPVGILIVAVLVVLASLFASRESKTGLYAVAGVFALAAVVTFVLSMVVTVKPGHTGVAVFFGDVNPIPRKAGIHFENPLLDWKYYDCRQKSHKETAEVPSSDQLLTTIDVSVQYRLIPGTTPQVLSETGSLDDVLQVHLVPKLRSILREQGKTVKRAEDFFNPDTQARLQMTLLTNLRDYLAGKGIDVQDILLRNIVLPPTVREGVESKKRRDQEAEKQKSELRRFETEQQQKVAQAKAERQAAEEEAMKKKVLADAQAYEIQKINEAIASNPAYIQLEALKALREMSRDPSAKLYFLNGDSPAPVPFMNIGALDASTPTPKAQR